MRDYPDDESFDDEDYSDGEDVTPDGGTRPVARRPIPADDLPTSYARPALSRKPDQRRVTLPDTSQQYPDQTQAVRPPRRKRGRDRSERPSRPMQSPRPRRDKASSGLYLPWWSLVIMLVFVGCAAFGMLLVVSSLQNNGAAGGQTPLVIVITSTFTVGPPASPTPLPQKPTLTPSPPLPTIPPSQTLPPGNFAVGSTVQVIGVGPSGLNVRSAPGVGSTVKFLAHDGDVYTLKDGPQTASSDEWWFIQDANDSTRGGWASRRFLTVQGSAPPTATPAS